MENSEKNRSCLTKITTPLLGDSVENKPASLLVVSLGKALNGTPPPLCGRQVAHPYFTGLQL